MFQPILADEIFSKNPSMNAHIHRILNKFTGQSHSRMLREIRQARKNCDSAVSAGDMARITRADAQARHAFREFLVGEHFLEKGCTSLEYCPTLDGKTPDWFDHASSLIVEVFTNERGGTTNFKDRLRLSIQKKVQKYGSIVDRRSLSFIIAIHPDFLGGVDDSDVLDAIREGKIFEKYSELSEILSFSDFGAR